MPKCFNCAEHFLEDDLQSRGVFCSTNCEQEYQQMWAYEEAYNNATGESATYRKGSSDYHTLRFVKWLVSQLEFIRGEYTEVSVERSNLQAEVERLREMLKDNEICPRCGDDLYECCECGE